MPANEGRLIGGMCTLGAVVAGEAAAAVGEVQRRLDDRDTPPASISVISARYRPRSRSAGSVISEPMIIVTRPASISTRMYGWPVANSSRAPTQAPIVQHGELAEGVQADPADEQPEAERHDGVDGHLGHRVRVVRRS